MTQNGWGEYQKLVLSELERLDESITKLTETVVDLKGDVKVLYFKAGVWGASAGLIPVLIAIGLYIIKG